MLYVSDWADNDEPAPNIDDYNSPDDLDYDEVDRTK